LVPHEAPLEWVAGGGLVFAVALFWVKLKKNEAYGDSLVELVGQSVFTGDAGQAAELGRLDNATAFRLADLMQQAASHPVAINYADMLESLAPEYAGEAMLSVYPSLPPKLQDQLLLRLARLAPSNWEAIAMEAAQHGDAHLVETTARLLLAADCPAAKAQAQNWLDADSPRLQSAAAVGCLHGDATEPALRAKSREVLERFLTSRDSADYLAALGALAAMPHEDLLPWVRPMLVDDSARARALALKVWSRCPQSEGSGAARELDAAMRDASHEVRAAAIRAAAQLQLPNMPALDWLGGALRDPDYRVRQVAHAFARSFMPKHREGWVKALTQRETDFELQTVMVSELSATDIESKATLLRQASERHARHARNKLLIMENIPHAEKAFSQEYQLLKQVLREEARRHLDAVLHILGCLDHGQQMRYIRAGLASRDKHLWAQALESAMQLKKEGHLFRELAILFEAERESSPLGGEPPAGNALGAWLDWCQEYGSEWLAQCAKYCQGKSRVEP